MNLLSALLAGLQSVVVFSQLVNNVNIFTSINLERIQVLKEEPNLPKICFRCEQKVIRKWKKQQDDQI